MAALTSPPLPVGSSVAADFEAWYHDGASRAALQAPLPPMMEVLPGMTQVSVRIDPAVRSGIAKLFRDFPKGKRTLTHDEFAARWADVEPGLAAALSMMEAVEVLEKAGRRHLQEAYLDRGLTRDASEAKGAEASAYFLKGDSDRRAWIEAVGWRDDSSGSQKLLQLMSQKPWSRKLNESQKTRLCDFILSLNKENVTTADLEAYLAEKKPQFKKKLGFEMPDPRQISELLAELKNFLRNK